MRKWSIAVASVAFIAFHIYALFITPLPGHQLRAAHLGFALVLTFLWFPLHERLSLKRKRHIAGALALDAILMVAGAASMYYLYTTYFDLIFRAGRVNPTDLAMGIAAIAVTLEATRRLTGWALPLLVVLFLLYAGLGSFIPEPFDHRGFNINQIIYFQYLTMEGLFGAPLGASASIVVFFIVFAAFLQQTRAGDFYVDLANSLVGKTRGGAAKVAAVSSGFLGSISGAAAANVVTSGAFTIPMMKKTGYRPVFAGAVEAVASTGGQIMPPVMGAVAFVMAEMMGIPYAEVVKAAIIPALLFYLSVLVTIDLEAGRTGLKGLPQGMLPKLLPLLKAKGHLFIPLLVLLYALIILGLSPSRSAILGTVAVIVVALLNKETRIGIAGFFAAIQRAAKDMLIIATATASAGVIIGIMSTTGLGMRLSSILIQLAQAELIPLLILTMVASIILGMGVPTTAAYVMLAVLVAPALTELGVPPIAAHMFVVYFGILSNITPPVAIAAFAASALSGTNPIHTAAVAMKIGLIAYIIPFMFVFSPELLLVDPSWLLAAKLSTSVIGIYALGGALNGYFYGLAQGIFQRVLLGTAALLLIQAQILTDSIGLLLILGLILWQARARSALPAVELTATPASTEGEERRK